MEGHAAFADDTRAKVTKYYGETLQSTSDLKTSACCTAKPPPPAVVALLRRVPAEIVERYYGCGSPFPQGIAGKRVLDLGCGTGRDCYVCAALVGASGSVTGIDMTDAQLDVARRHEAAWAQELGYAAPNTRFVKGRIEYLDEAGIPDASVDVVISNCVLNLSAEKPRCLQQVHRVLADGGEFLFSDVYSDRRLPAAARAHEVALGECLGGALYVNDFLELARAAGFSDGARALAAEPIEVHDAELAAVLGGAKFYSVTFRLFKLPQGRAEPRPEDYGQTATYRGTVPGEERAYTLDLDFTFPAGVPVPVDAGTAAVLSAGWLSGHFDVSNRCCKPHLGQFAGRRELSAAAVAALAAAAPAKGNGGCCPPAAAAAAPANGNGGCCPPAAAAAAPANGNGGCCPPAAAPKSNGNGCCPPKSGGACC